MNYRKTTPPISSIMLLNETGNVVMGVPLDQENRHCIEFIEKWRAGIAHLYDVLQNEEGEHIIGSQILYGEDALTALNLPPLLGRSEEV